MFAIVVMKIGRLKASWTQAIEVEFKDIITACPDLLSYNLLWKMSGCPDVWMASSM
jgi:hypothetical protein